MSFAALGLSAAELASLAAASAGTAGATAAGAGGATALGAGAGALGGGMLAAEAAPAAMGAAEGGGLSSGMAGMGLDEALGPLPATMKGDVGGMLKPPDVPGLGNPMDILGGGGAPAPAPSLPQAPPPQPYTPTTAKLADAMPSPEMGSSEMFQNGPRSMPEPATDWRGHLKTAQQVLGLASNLTTNKKDKQTLALMQMASGMGAADNAESTLKAIQGPLGTIASTTEEPKRLDQAMAQPQARPQPAPMQTSQPQVEMPPTRLADNYPDMGMEDRLRMIRGY